MARAVSPDVAVSSAFEHSRRSGGFPSKPAFLASKGGLPPQKVQTVSCHPDFEGLMASAMPGPSVFMGKFNGVLSSHRNETGFEPARGSQMITFGDRYRGTIRCECRRCGRSIAHIAQ